MKTVVYYRPSGFNEHMSRLRSYGGSAGKAYRKVGEIRQNLELGHSPAGRTTDNGETRIKSAVKYDLGSGYRLVTIASGEVIFFCFVGTHDDTDRWLESNRGLAPVKNKEGKIGLIKDAIIENGHLPAPKDPSASALPLYESVEGIDFEDLFPSNSLKRQFKRLSLISSDDDVQDFLDDISSDSSPEAASRIQDLILACRDKDSEKARLIADLIRGEAAIVGEDSPELSGEDVRSSVNSEEIVVLSDLSEKEIDRLWDKTRFQDWMVYLHPGQKRIVDEDYENPAILGGVSGSGKTCVLIHRAKRLAAKYPGENVLILTLNRSLARFLERLLTLLTDKNSEHIKVEAFHDYVSRLLNVTGKEEYFTDIGNVYGMDAELQTFLREAEHQQLNNFFAFQDTESTKRFWERYLSDQESGAHMVANRSCNYLRKREKTIDAAEYLGEELELIRSRFRFFEDYDDYLEYDRKGKGRALGIPKDRREDILNTLNGWEKYQFRHGFLDAMTISQAALWAIDHSNGIPGALRYRCVLVDEFQDFSTQELRLIAEIPTTTENGLFLTGDSGQKIFAKDFDLNAAGLSKEKRTNRAIQKNYRNSREILEASTLLLNGYSSEAAAKAAGVTVLNPEFATRRTAKPFVSKTNDPIRAAWHFATEWIDDGCPSYAVAIVTADPENLPIQQIIDQTPPDLSAARLTGDSEQDQDRVIVSDLQTVKGFEFSLVIVVGCADQQFPKNGRAQGEVWRDALKLYVAMTRARDELVLIHSGTPSHFLRLMAPALSKKNIHFPPDKKRSPVPKKDTSRAENKSTPKKTYQEPKKIIPSPSAPTTKDERGEKTPVHEESIEGDANDGREEPSDTPFSSSISGYNIVPVRLPANQSDLARALGVERFRIFTLLHQKWNELPPPDQPIQKGYIKLVFREFGCVPSFQNSSPKKEAETATEIATPPEVDFSETVDFSSYKRPRCIVDGCEAFAMHMSDHCYEHDPE